jgi:hypothetical protein
MRPDIVPGAVFPDYALSDHNEVVRGLSELQGTIWDLATPGLREAWDAGDWSWFHGWNTRPQPAALPH